MFSADLTVREACEADADLVADLGALLYPPAIVPDRQEIHRILSGMRAWNRPWPRRWSAPSFVAHHAGELVGYLLGVHQESQVNPGEDVIYLWDAAVSRKYRGGGAAPLMVGRILGVAFEHGVAVEADARESTSYALFQNRRVIQWFRKRGFERTYEQRWSAATEMVFLVRFEPKPT